jgi:UDP-N-acetylglucosamine acyltransferase
MKHDSSNRIHPTAIVGPGVRLGRNNYIGPGCIIGGPCESRKKWNPNAPGMVIIGNNNIFTGLVTIDGGMENITIIGNDTFWMKHSHGGHDCTVGDGATISCGAKIGGHASIGGGTNIGLNATIHQRVQVPHDCMIGMGAAVTKRTAMREGYKYAGVPARELGENIKK